MEASSTFTTQHVRVPMRDGVHLDAVLHHAGAGTSPVLLLRSPYDETMARLVPVMPALKLGFAVVVQNCRGTGLSEGEFRPFECEEEDGLDAIDWICAQDWSDGRIAMMGPSYLGMAQMAVAGARPAGLKVISPAMTPDDYRDGLVYRQGAFALGSNLSWHLLKAGQVLGERAALDVDITAQAASLGALAADPGSAYGDLPLLDRPAINDLLSSWRDWLEKETDAGYWGGISFSAAASNHGLPVLYIGGWFDVFLRGTLNNYCRGVAGGNTKQRLIVGPWGHVDQSGVIGDFLYPGGDAGLFRLEYQQLTFLRDGVDDIPSTLPPIQIYVMGADRWRVELEWPLARTDWQNWYFGAEGELSTVVGVDGEVNYIHDPSDPVPTIGGAVLLMGSRDGGVGYQPGSRDQASLDDRIDIVRFCSPPLEHDLEVTGPVEVTLYAATSAADTDFTAKLVDVHPDGRVMWVCDGIVRARYCSGMDESVAVETGKTHEYRIDLGATSQLFRAGHRLRVDVASSNFPVYDPNSGTGKPSEMVSVDDLQVAHQTIRFGISHASLIRLPVILAAEVAGEPGVHAHT